MNSRNLSELIKLAITEDAGDGDHTSLSCIPDNVNGQARLLIKDHGIVAGINVAQMVFHQIDPELELELLLKDGAKVKNGDVAFVVSGKVLSILQSERLVLNFMQRMSGIATTTNKYVRKLEGLKTRILDTRKTTPGLRVFEKAAVKTGGGENHRMGLYDMIMLKDNHIDFAGGIREAINSTHAYLKSVGKDLSIEIEARNLDEIREILKTGEINRIMLDNFTLNDTRKAVELINGKFETESSGGITLETVLDYAECGVDFISVGALTHQIHSLDMSLKAFSKI
ncbi:MAG: carboxylating nicotinate-nucleotide diphosphorylase [Bacteroidetes bacterium]|nr:carboxylating nicotinate-nucleotide diphosphorylase [Bacteroidota bacterium]